MARATVCHGHWRIASLVAPTLATFVVVTGGCGVGSADDVPETLADGSPARVPDFRFEGAAPPVLLTARRALDLPAALAERKVAACVRAGWSNRPAEPVVHRAGVSGESVTFPSASGRTLQACDGAGGPTSPEPWCGHVFGRPVDGRLRDPRLDLGACRTSSGDPISFVWVEPASGTRYVLVDRLGFSEAYEVGDGLPVRVAVTEGVDVARSRAVVHVSEHSSSGRLLRSYELEAVVSG